MSSDYTIKCECGYFFDSRVEDYPQCGKTVMFDKVSITYGYCFQVVGQGQNGVASSYGILFALSEAEAKGHAVSYFKEHHSRCAILNVMVKQAIFQEGFPVAIENNMLVSKGVE